MPLTAFVLAVDEGSFSAAARRLGLAPSSVARQVDRLEDEVDARLLIRSSRSLRLTEAGTRYLVHARQILEQAEAARIEARGFDAEPAGLIRVTAFNSFGQRRVCPRLPAFFARYPKVRVELQLSDRMVDLRREGFDVGLRIGPPPDSDLLMRRLYDNRTVLVCAPALRDRLGAPAHPSDLATWPCLTLHPERDPVPWHFTRGDERASVPVSGPLTARGGLPLHRGCLAGLGPTVLTRWLVEDDLRAGRLVQMLPGWGARLRDDGRGAIYMVYPKERRSHAATRAFVEFIAEAAGYGAEGPPEPTLRSERTPPERRPDPSPGRSSGAGR